MRTLPRDVFMFCHAPKTGGTTIANVISEMVGADVSYVEGQNGTSDFLDDLRVKLEEGAAFFAGHVPLPTLVALRDEHADFPIRLLFSVRDPLAHFVSSFLHSRTFLDDGLTRRKNLDPLELLRAPDDDDLFDASSINVLTRYLLGQRAHALPADAAERASAALEHVDFIFDCDALGHSLDQFAARFGFNPPTTVPELNTNAESSVLLAKWRDQLEVAADKVLALDASVVGLARRRPELAEMPSRLPSGRRIYLSEVIRRLDAHARIDAEPNHFEYRNNDLFLHPPAAGATSVAVDDLIVVQPGDQFRVVFELADCATDPVVFGIRLKVARAIAFSCEMHINPGGIELLELPLATSDAAAMSLELWTALTPRGRAEGAWATFVAPCLIRPAAST